MERYRHNGVRITQEVVAHPADHVGQWRGQPPPALVFEGMEDPSQRTLVVAGRPRGVNGAAAATTTRTPFERGADDAP
jgi:hypothetical protein